PACSSAQWRPALAVVNAFARARTALCWSARVRAPHERAARRVTLGTALGTLALGSLLLFRINRRRPTTA
ncbi:MAG: hypothetical protein ABSA31_08650, partial [Acidimicrobiales bacterium]